MSAGLKETRRFYLLPAKCGRETWAGLKSFICFEKYTYNLITGEENIEQRFYITSLNDVTLAAQTIRGHWAVENSLHWHLDYSFSEDEQSTMDKTAFQNLSLVNKLVLSLCKLAQPVMKGSIRSIRLRFSWELKDSLSLLLNSFDDGAIKKSLESAVTSKK